MMNDAELCGDESLRQIYLWFVLSSVGIKHNTDADQSTKIDAELVQRARNNKGLFFPYGKISGECDV